MLADEPTGALDSVNGEAVMRLLRGVCSRGAAGVVVTHEAQLAAWANRVVFLRDGRLVDETGKPDGPESLLASGPPTIGMSGHRSGPARRAVLRWAWRLFRRDWRQQVLVLALMVVAVAAATTVATVATNARRQEQSEVRRRECDGRAGRDEPDDGERAGRERAPAVRVRGRDHAPLGRRARLGRPPRRARAGSERRVQPFAGGAA